MFTTADASGNVTVQQEDGSAVTFTKGGSTYTPPTRVLATLQTNTFQTLAPNCPDDRPGSDQARSVEVCVLPNHRQSACRSTIGCALRRAGHQRLPNAR